MPTRINPKIDIIRLSGMCPGSNYEFFSFYFIVVQQHQRKSILLLAGCILAAINFYFLLWSGSRQGVLLALLFTPIIFLVFYRPSMRRMLSVISALLGLSALVFFLLGDHGVIGKFVERFDDLSNLKTVGGRLAVWEYAIELIQGNYLLGIGPDTFIKIREPRTWVIQVHNAPLQFLIEAGVIACLLFVTSISLLLVKAKKLLSNLPRNSHEYQFSLLTFCFLIAYLMNSMVDGIFYHVLPIYMFSMASALLVYQFDTADELVDTV